MNEVWLRFISDWKCENSSNQIMNWIEWVEVINSFTDPVFFYCRGWKATIKNRDLYIHTLYFRFSFEVAACNTHLTIESLMMMLVEVARIQYTVHIRRDKANRSLKLVRQILILPITKLNDATFSLFRCIDWLADKLKVCDNNNKKRNKLREYFFC